MSAVTDRLTDQDQAVIARIIFNVRRRLAAELSAADAEPSSDQGGGERRGDPST